MTYAAFHYLIPTLHVLSCLFLIVVVLLQTGKGADMGAVFGGGSQTLFGSGGAGNFLTRLTTATAIIFMLTSLVLTYGQTPSSSSRLIQKLPAPDAAVPQQPAADQGAPAEAPVANAPEAGGEPAAETPPAADQAPAATPPAGTQAPAPAAPPPAAEKK